MLSNLLNLREDLQEERVLQAFQHKARSKSLAPDDDIPMMTFANSGCLPENSWMMQSMELNQSFDSSPGLDKDDYSDEDDSDVESSQLSKYQSKQKANSTSSLYICSTLSVPDKRDITYSITQKLYSHLINGHQHSKKMFYDIFDENQYPLTKHAQTLVLPSPEEVYSTLHKIFLGDCLPAEICILSLVFLDRLVESSGISIHASNYRRVFLISTVLACKVWEDNAVWISDFVDVYPKLTLDDIRSLECAMLHLLNYEVTVTGSSYAKYYFQLRDTALEEKESWSVKPLNKEAAQELEIRSSQQCKMWKRGSKRAYSVDQFAQLNPLILS